MVAGFQATSKLNTNPYWWLMGPSAVKVRSAIAVMLPENVLLPQRVVLMDSTLDPKDGGAQNGLEQEDIVGFQWEFKLENMS